MSIADGFNPLDLTGKRVLITGASSGIGRATAIYLSRLNARVVLVARNEGRLNETLKMMEGTGHALISVDLEQDEDLGGLFVQATADGKLNGLVHCAGISQVLPLNMLTRKRLQKEMAINYFSYIELVRQYAKSKFSEGGSIVGISSAAADRPGKCQTNYSATKAAMDIASQALSIELAAKNIRINTVLPGMIQTEMVDRIVQTGSNLDDILRSQVLGIGKPEDVAAMCAFLLSDMSRLITGRRLFVDGGRFL